MNLSIITGRIVGDIEYKTTKSDKKLATFQLGFGELYKSGDELRRNRMYVKVICWERTAEIVNSVAQKGDNVMVCGKLTQEKWETKGGQKRYQVAIVAFTVQVFADKPSYVEAESQEYNPNDPF